MADERLIKRGGKYCVAGSRDNVSCTNTSYSTGISMHKFPSDKVVCQKLTSFVRKHRPNFKPSKTMVLCSAHFEPTCFTQLASVLSLDCATRRVLVRGSISTRDTVVSFTPEPLTSRGKRQVSSFILGFRFTCINTCDSICARLALSILFRPELLFAR